MSHPFANLGPIIIGALGDPAPITVTRYAAGSYVDGVWVQGASTAATVAAVVQPSGPRELRQLPENERTMESISVWTVDPLFTSDVASSIEADVITWQSRTFRVRVVERWDLQAGYCKAIAVRLGE